jgi:transcriptional regulator of arginine metabolism
MAQAAAAAVDGMGWSEIVGTIAGDATIFVMMRDNTAAVEFAERLKLIGRGSES